MENITYVFLIVALLPLAAHSHHAYRVAYDFNRTETLEGEVLKLELVNPHARIFVNVRKENGEEEEWMIEGPGRLALARRGWTDDMFEGGGTITAVGNPSSEGHHAIWLEKLVMPNGTEILDPLVSDQLEIEAQRRERVQRANQ
jgi:hypothetical protein